ncbi:MAG: hypothetical protein ACM30I_11920 [Gemmatimonas sp.]
MTDHPSWPGPASIRSRLILETAAAITAADGEAYREAEVRLLPQRGTKRPLVMTAASTVDCVERVVTRELDLSFINPSSALTVAYVGKSSQFPTPQPVRSIAVLPSLDQCLLAVKASTGLTHIEDIARARLPLRVSVRGSNTHWLHCMLEDIFRACGFSGEDLRAWGGELRKEGKIPGPGDLKFQAFARGEIDGIFDEGPVRWATAAIDAGMRVLQLREETVARLEAIGYRRAWLDRREYPGLPENVLTLDFSGWPLFVRADADDTAVRAICTGLEARTATIPWEGPGPLPLATMCRGGEGAPLDVPLHAAAARFWTERGYL